MALVSGGRSTLNPNAPLYIPAFVRQVEDFSPEWWNLVTTSTWFRDYWLSQNQVEDFFTGDDGFGDNDVIDLLPDSIDIGLDEEVLNMEAQFEEFLQSSETGYSSTFKAAPEYDAGALVKNLNYTKGKVPKFAAEPAKHVEKPSKYISPKCSPRRIQQPR